MDIREFRKRKDQMEQEMALALAEAMDNFRNDTGYSPNSIRVSLVSTPLAGEETRYYMVNSVITDVEL